MKIERHRWVVEIDLPDIYAFIAKDDPATAERVLDAVEATLEQLTRQPESGVIYRPRSRSLRGLRMLPVAGFANYLVFYRLEADAIRLLYVTHGARHLSRLFRRERRV